MPDNPIFQPKLSFKQTQAFLKHWQPVDRDDLSKGFNPNPDITDVMYGGAKGGGKSHYLCVWAYNFALWISIVFKLPRSDNPVHVGWIGRKQAVDFTSTTLATWRRIIPQEVYQIKSGTEKETKHILIDGRVAIDFGGLDRQENVNKFNSAEYAFIGVDQAEEVTKDDIAVLRASRRLTIDGKALPYKGLFTANPANCWLKSEFITDPKKNMVFIQALPSDNQYLPLDYHQTIIDAFGHRPEILKAYWDGDWTVYEGANQIIKSMWLDAAASRECFHDYMREFLVCDPARFGDDETVIMRFIDTDIAEKIVLPYCKTTEISNRLCMESILHGDIPIVVESTGGDVGAGVVDELAALKRNVIVFNPAGKASRDVYYNLRAEAWWEAGKMLSCGIADPDRGVLVVIKNLDNITKEQLYQPTYFYRNGRLLVEDKADIKKRLKRSPDHGDCFIIGLWAYPMIQPKVLIMRDTIDRNYGREERRRLLASANNNPMTCV